MHVNENLARLEALPQTIVAHRRDLDKDEAIPRHRHRRAQLVYASSGVMTVTTEDGAFVVPPQRAVWMPGGIAHRIDARSPVAMRTLYVEPTAAPDLPQAVCVLQVNALLRELILAAIAARPDYPPGGPEERVMSVILDQIRILPVAPLSLPIPADPRLRQIVETLIADPTDARGLEQWARSAGASARTLARLFAAQTGMSFRAWRQQRRLLRALEMLAAGDKVTAVALELGYDSTSAFSAMFRRSLGTTPTRYFASPV
jgi:AraC-like DNA-binding protein